jgi:hypothetical protein
MLLLARGDYQGPAALPFGPKSRLCNRIRARNRDGPASKQHSNSQNSNGLDARHDLSLRIPASVGDVRKAACDLLLVDVFVRPNGFVQTTKWFRWKTLS